MARRPLIAVTGEPGEPPLAGFFRLYGRDLHAVDRRQRVEETVPLLAAVPPDPELARRGAEVERRRLLLVDVHRVAQHREIGLFLREAASEPAPRVAAVLAEIGRASCRESVQTSLLALSVGKVNSPD